MKAKGKLTKKQQRILAVVNDALEQIKLGIYKPTSGEYFELIGPDRRERYEIVRTSDASAQDFLKTNPKCEVCAKGALFCSLVRLENKVTQSDLTIPYTRESMLEELLGMKQAELVEQVFEGWEGYTKLIDALPNDEDRLLYILRNMKRNKGKFVLYKKYDR